MLKAPIPENEQDRLIALQELNILDTGRETRFDKITEEVAQKLKIPICIISLIDSNREWYKSCHGLDSTEGPRENSFCGHAMLASNIFIVEDTLLDERFKDNPQVVGSPFIRFYAGVALYNKIRKLPVGVLCVKDYKPRKFEITEINFLIESAKKVEDRLNNKTKI